MTRPQDSWTKDDKADGRMSRRALATGAAGLAVAIGGVTAASAVSLDRGRVMRGLGSDKQINLKNSTVGELKLAGANESDPAKSSVYRAAIAQLGDSAAGDPFSLFFDLKKKELSSTRGR